MSDKFKFRDPAGMYFITATTTGWVDVFTRPELKHVIIDSLRHCQAEKGLAIHAWCLMTSHLHMICSSSGEDLSRIMMTFKSHTSKEVIKILDNVYESRRDWILKHFYYAGEDLRRITNFKVWKDGNHPIQLTKARFTKQKMNYIHNNPVAEEIVAEPEDYLYSSARDYCTNRRGLLAIEFV